ncbi:Amino-acid acetyltransferase, mitochondrial [Apophysomyces ossiformis]|uniref:Amino-acid acetyltransferase, mitochondrial n=1 Tax=Apophysomyces ossiformis TaxID=679940 RepID=A0A8H7EQJ1_9FUNG|nr:Amino-acid acetyltransferase, mitochondrial [Apophysomyces ossiformis]
MNTTPSKRELRHFLKRYVPQPIFSETSTATTTSSSTTTIGKGKLRHDLTSPKDYVHALLNTSALSHPQLALTKVKGPFQKDEWQSIGSTLVQLQKLGLHSIVVMDNERWSSLLDRSSAELSKTMVSESMALVEAIEKAHGRARLIYGSLVVTEEEKEEEEEQEEKGKKKKNKNKNKNMKDSTKAVGFGIHTEFIETALEKGLIPVVIPTTGDSRPHRQQQAGGRSMHANEVLVGLTRQLADHPKTTPTKVVVINHEGGIPNHERPGTAHSLVNLAEEHDTIVEALEKETKGWSEAKEHLELTRQCLSVLPTSSSAVLVPVRSLPSALLANLVTDKPLYSSSLPLQKLHTGDVDLQRVNRSRTTILRQGIKLHHYHRLSELHLDRLTQLLEASFQKTLDTQGFYDRLDRVLDGAIIAGDYEGAVLVTKERALPSATKDGFAYLDKFAIAPASQGVGVTDILWRHMCDAYPELLWRSRQDNGVNKW